jgi:hypothetical protein
MAFCLETMMANKTADTLLSQRAMDGSALQRDRDCAPNETASSAELQPHSASVLHRFFLRHRRRVLLLEESVSLSPSRSAV